MFLHYQGDEGCNTIESMNKRVNKLLLNNTKTEAAFRSIKLRSFFNVNDKVNFKHNYDLIYPTKCLEPTCIFTIMLEKVFV